MQSIGLALTLSLLTGGFVALDLTSVRTTSAPETLSQASISDRNNALAIMPSSVPGVIIPKADIGNGVFAVGSSTGREGLDDEEQDLGHQEDDADEADEAAGAPASNAGKAINFVLI